MVCSYTTRQCPRGVAPSPPSSSPSACGHQTLRVSPPAGVMPAPLFCPPEVVTQARATVMRRRPRPSQRRCCHGTCSGVVGVQAWLQGEQHIGMCAGGCGSWPPGRGLCLQGAASSGLRGHGGRMQAERPCLSWPCATARLGTSCQMGHRTRRFCRATEVAHVDV